MTPTNGTLAQLASQENKALIHLWATLKGTLNDAREQLQQVEYVLMQRMAKDGATAIPDEVLPSDVIATAWTPEHQETITVPEKWNATHFKAWVKYGQNVADVIDQAKIPGPPKLRIKPKKGE